MSKLDMDKILDELVSFDGISHSCIYQNEQIMASTFPSVIEDKLSGMGAFIDKIFSSAHAIDRNHDEIHIELEENTLIAYRVNDDFLLILMAAKSINLSLVYMTIKSIEKSVKVHGITPPEAKPSQPNFLNVSNTKAIVNGGLFPFTGPIIKKDGTTVVAEGEKLSLEALLGMDWYIQGVDVVGL